MQRGQALLEALVYFKAFSLLVLFCLCLGYLTFSHHYTHYTLYRSLLCLEELGRSPLVCKRKLSAKLKLALPFHKKKKLSLKRSQSFNSVRFQSQFLGQSLTYIKKIKKG